MAFPSKAFETSLDHDSVAEDEFNQSPGAHMQHRNRPSKINLVNILATLTILGWALAATLYSKLDRPVLSYMYDDVDTRIHECGSSVQEAKRLGCQWDPVSFAWLPERCLDHELAHELLYETDWTLHADMTGNVTRSNEEFSENTSTTYLTNANHATHCIYSWKRMHRLLLAGKPYHSGLSYQHTKHCSHVLKEAVHADSDAIKTTALVIFPKC